MSRHKRAISSNCIATEKGEVLFNANSSNTLKTTGEKCGPKPPTLLLNTRCVIWPRNPIRIQSYSRQVSHLLGALTFEKLPLKVFVPECMRGEGGVVANREPGTYIYIYIYVYIYIDIYLYIYI